MLRYLAAILALSAAATAPLGAQVSPGPLSLAHHSLDSPLKCGDCHIFGRGTARRFRCSWCHTEIASLVRRQEGYHGRVAKNGDADCARCHSEHYGEDFRIFKWPDTQETFDHRQTGYPLTGRHAALQCRQCHNASHIAEADRKIIKVRDLSKTFEGMRTACLGCHEDHHAAQLGTNCEKCHTNAGWKPIVGFDHSTTRFPLAGKHRTVECAKCHKPTPANAKVLQYKGLSFAACTGCHQDPHHGAFPEGCVSCHNLEDWKRAKIAPEFDHSSTKFPLTGKHQEVACLKCHKSADFKSPVAHEKCADCHQDRHQGQFSGRADRGECGSCHVVAGWKPATFTAAGHQSTGFPLAGKHQGVACAKCHPPAGAATNYRPASKACLDCHKDPHNGQFASAPRDNRCEGCHTVDGFKPSTFSLADHRNARFTLKGAHAAVACGECHKKTGGEGPVQFRFASLACEACHRDPHKGDFPASLTARVPDGQSVCESCHEQTSWERAKQFDHAITGFALAGAHIALSCVSCHKPAEPEGALRPIPFQTAPKQCAGCHEDIHGGQFRQADGTVDCSRCHTPERWKATLFNHETGTKFSLVGAHANVPCELCHKQTQTINGRTVLMYRDTSMQCAACHR